VQAFRAAFVVALLVAAVACDGSKPALPDVHKAAPDDAPASSPPELPPMPADPDHLGSVPIEVQTTIGDSTFTTKGVGECTFTSSAAIYDVPAAMWHAALRAEGQSVSYVNATIWQFKNRTPTQIAVGLQAGPRFRHISTIKGSARVGEGTANAERAGEQAIISVNGKDENGSPLSLRIQCAKVTKPVEEGGR
jgi:hypothetical protein